jgi:hypothetical protein
MKHLIFLFLIQFAACTTETETPHATFASIETPEPETQRAYNVAISKHGVTAYYADSDAQFNLYFNQCCVIETPEGVKRMEAEVYQESPGVWIAELPGGDFVRLNTKTGNTGLVKDGKVKMYYPSKRP